MSDTAFPFPTNTCVINSRKYAPCLCLFTSLVSWLMQWGTWQGLLSQHDSLTMGPQRVLCMILWVHTCILYLLFCQLLPNKTIIRMFATFFYKYLFSELRLRSCLFCEGRISVLKRWFKTPIQNAVNSGYCSSSSEPERRLYDVI